MSAAFFFSRWACLRSGVFGTAVAICAAALLWMAFAGVKAVWGSGPVGLLVMAPALLTLALGGWSHASRTPPGNPAVALSLFGTVWTVGALTLWVAP